MSTKIVSYDLKKPETSEDYKNLFTYIKNNYNWAKPLESFWLISTPKSCSIIRDELQRLVDPNDKVLVMETTRMWASFGLHSDVVDWLQEH